MTAMELPIYNPEYAAGDRVLVANLDCEGDVQHVLALVVSDAIVDDDFIAVMARSQDFDLIGRTDDPSLAGLRHDLPAGFEVNLVMIDECVPAYRSLRLAVDNTRNN